MDDAISISIRRATPADLPVLLELEQQFLAFQAQPTAVVEWHRKIQRQLENLDQSQASEAFHGEGWKLTTTYLQTLRL